MTIGKDIIRACETGNIELFTEKLMSIEFEQRKMVFWHTAQGFKKAIENR